MYFSVGVSLNGIFNKLLFGILNPAPVILFEVLMDRRFSG